MSDLIYRQAAIDELNKLDVSDGVGISSVACDLQEEAIRSVENLPSADTVEVVRCRDCKHRYIDGENVRYNVCDLNHNKVQEDDWYCADAERRTDE